MAVRQRGTSWQADITFQGKRYRETLDSREEAVAWEGAARLALKRGEPLPGAKVQGQPVARELQFATVAKRVYHSHYEGGRDPGAWTRLNLLINWFDGEEVQDVATREAIQGYIDHCREDGNKNSTIIRKVAVLKVILKAAADDHGITLPNWPKISHRQTRRLVWLTDEQELRIISALYRWGKNEAAEAFQVFCDTGMRMSELWRTRGDEIDWQHGHIRVWADASKTDRARSIPLTRRARGILTARNKVVKGGILFPNLTTITYNRLWRRLRKELLDIDTAVMTPYITRHTFASRLLQSGARLYEVQTLLGHTNPNTTQKYAFLEIGTLSESIDRLQNRNPYNVTDRVTA